MTITEPAPAAPPVGGRDLQIATRATKAVLDRLLVDSGMTFEQMVVLNTIELAGGSLPTEALVAELVATLKIDDDAARNAIATTIDAGLVHAIAANAGALELSASGRDLRERYTQDSAQVSAAVWGGLDHADLVATKRVLDAVTDRANTLLSDGAAPA